MFNRLAVADLVIWIARDRAIATLALARRTREFTRLDVEALETSHTATATTSPASKRKNAPNMLILLNPTCPVVAAPVIFFPAQVLLRSTLLARIPLSLLNCAQLVVVERVT